MNNDQDNIRSFLVIGNSGLHRIFCPFKVICVIEIDVIKVGDVLIVQKVTSYTGYKIVYIINSKAFSYHYFNVITSRI
jgi:hypothetical protein